MNKITATGPDFTVTVEYEDLPVGEAVNLVVATVRALRYERRPVPPATLPPVDKAHWRRVNAPVLEVHAWWYVSEENPGRYLVVT